ncbi:MAG TPA: ECF transporter S component [Ruminococcaceae bacterium]|nr:ECF transporter S component [Oscillospiraceae bacterium]
MFQTKKRTNHILWIAQAGLLIALMVVVQLLTFAIPKSVPLVGQLFTGSLVNLVLIVGAGTLGLPGTAAAAILSPILAFAFGQMAFPQLIPVIAVGNLILVAITWIFFSHDGAHYQPASLVIDTTGIILGAVVKFLFLWLMVSKWIVPLLFNTKPIVANMISFMFSWPQLVTAIIGGFLSLLVLTIVRNSRIYL